MFSRRDLLKWLPASAVALLPIAKARPSHEEVQRAMSKLQLGMGGPISLKAALRLKAQDEIKNEMALQAKCQRQIEMEIAEYNRTTTTPAPESRYDESGVCKYSGYVRGYTMPDSKFVLNDSLVLAASNISVSMVETHHPMLGLWPKVTVACSLTGTSEAMSSLWRLLRLVPVSQDNNRQTLEPRIMKLQPHSMPVGRGDIELTDAVRSWGKEGWHDYKLSLASIPLYYAPNVTLTGTLRTVDYTGLRATTEPVVAPKHKDLRSDMDGLVTVLRTASGDEQLAALHELANAWPEFAKEMFNRLCTCPNNCPSRSGCSECPPLRYHQLCQRVPEQFIKFEPIPNPDDYIREDLSRYYESPTSPTTTTTA